MIAGGDVTRTTARWRFLMLVAAMGAVMVVAVAQVSQPWRGILVAWLIFGGSVGYLTVRLTRHYHAYMVIPPMRKPHPTRALRLPEEAPHRAESLKIIVSKTADTGRRTI